jgi:Cobalamin biosynthesis protein CbiK, Co2+ chelatase
MSENAIILVSFGTSHNTAREKTINVLENEIKNAYSGYDVFTVFTSPTIRRILKNRDNIVIHDLETMFGILKDNGYKNVICQPTYIIKGFEYDNMAATAEAESAKVGLPLLSSVDDYDAVIDALDIANADEAYVLIGHGTAHEANITYSELERRFHERGYGNVYITTIEGDEDISVTQNTVNLIPLMFVAGDHAVNDIAGDKEDSYKSVFERNGHSVNIVLKGLGEYETIRKIYLNHIK